MLSLNPQKDRNIKSSRSTAGKKGMDTTRGQLYKLPRMSALLNEFFPLRVVAVGAIKSSWIKWPGDFAKP